MQAKFSLRGTKHHDLLKHDFPEAVFLCNGQMRVEEADSTGAGDTYDGAFIAALMDGKDLWSAGEYATAAGAVAVTRRGLMDIAPTREDIAAMMSRGR